MASSLPKRVLPIAGAFVMAVACSRREPNDAGAFRAPACRSAQAVVAEEANDRGRLRASWRAAIAQRMRVYDEVLSGTRAAYVGFVRVGDVVHGPLRGVVADDVVDGMTVRSLGLGGPVNTGITLAPKTPRQRGAFVVQLPNEAVECGHCVDLDTRELSLEPVMRFEPRRDMTVELRRLRPSEIDVARATALFPWLERARVEGTEVVVAGAREDVYVETARPAHVEPRFASCELSAVHPPEVRIATSCPSTWRVHFASDATELRCCSAPPYHGPARSGYYPEDCVSVATETRTP